MQQPSSFRIVRTQRDAPEADGSTEAPVFVIEENVGYVITFAAKLLVRSLAGCLAEHDVSPSQWVILQFLWANEGLTQTQLSRYVVIDDATMVRTIDRMERADLVRRVRNPHDRRQPNIFLTDKGHVLRDVLIPCAQEVHRSALQHFAPGEQAQLLDLLRRLIGVLEPLAQQP